MEKKEEKPYGLVGAYKLVLQATTIFFLRSEM